MPKLKGQENQRETNIFIDQHRREYIANCELLTGDPVDLTTRGWKAPLSPPWFKNMLTPPTDDHDIVKMVPKLERHRRGYQIFIDYQSWIEKNHRLMESWRDRFEAVAREGFKGQQLLDVLQNPPVELVRYMGAPPFPPTELIQAMAAGNEWALGLSDKVPPKAEALLLQLKPQIITMRGSTWTETPDLIDPFAPDGVLAEDDDDEPERVPYVEDPFGPGGAARSADELARMEAQFETEAAGGTATATKRKGR